LTSFDKPPVKTPTAQESAPKEPEKTTASKPSSAEIARATMFAKLGREVKDNMEILEDENKEVRTELFKTKADVEDMEEMDEKFMKRNQKLEQKHEEVEQKEEKMGSPSSPTRISSSICTIPDSTPCHSTSHRPAAVPTPSWIASLVKSC
jgi:hypothetical protein